MPRSKGPTDYVDEDWGTSAPESAGSALTSAHNAKEDWGTSFHAVQFSSEMKDVPGNVSFWGESTSVSRPLSISIERLSKADPKNVQEVAASQIQLLITYHQIVLGQSRRSFWWALAGACAGLAFFMTAIGFTIWTGNAVAASIPVISGALVEVVSGVVFYLYGKATTQLGDFYNRLEKLQRYLLANSICESLQGDARDEARATLIGEISSEHLAAKQDADGVSTRRTSAPRRTAAARSRPKPKVEAVAKPIEGEC